MTDSRSTPLSRDRVRHDPDVAVTVKVDVKMGSRRMGRGNP